MKLQRHILNQHVSSVEVEHEGVVVYMFKDVPTLVQMHPRVTSASGKSFTTNFVQGVGKHQTAWNVLIESGVIQEV